MDTRLSKLSDIKLKVSKFTLKVKRGVRKSNWVPNKSPHNKSQTSKRTMKDEN